VIGLLDPTKQPARCSADTCNVESYRLTIWGCCIDGIGEVQRGLHISTQRWTLGQPASRFRFSIKRRLIAVQATRDAEAEVAVHCELSPRHEWWMKVAFIQEPFAITL
jgi:hypothetical protein